MSIKKTSKTKKRKSPFANTISTVYSYLQTIKNLIPTDDKENIYCFRGQAVSNWAISSSLSRYESLKNEDFVKEMYEEVIQNFPEEFSEISKLTYEDLAKMQHYGIPTDLIDVSFNPLVALFFATENGKGKNNVQSGIVYVFRIPKEKCLFKTKDLVSISERKQEPLLIKTNFSNNRIRSQDGAFLYCKESSNFNEYIIHTVTIGNINKKLIRRELKPLNISYKTLFPELSDFYKDLKGRYF